MIDLLKSIGIEKGKPFAPDDTVKQALTEAVNEAHAWLDGQYEQFFTAPFFDDAHWAPARLDRTPEGSEPRF